MHIPTPAALFLIGAILGAASAEDSRSDSSIPEWFQAYMENEVGTWITDNGAYMSENETWEKYGLDWGWGVGNTSLIGSLYGMREGQPNVEFWQFRVYWHPGEREARIEQWGHGGTMLTGTLRPDGTEGGKDVFEAEQTMYATSGKTARLRHRSLQGDDVRIDRSFDWQDGDWQPRRQYTWHRQGDD